MLFILFIYNFLWINNNIENKFYEFNNKYKYIFTIIDHFSKFSKSYLLKDKKKENILENLKLFFEFYGIPEEFGSDNGREFINSSITSFLLKNNVKHIKGLPYNPRNQGAVERIHITIRNALFSLYLEDITVLVVF